MTAIAYKNSDGKREITFDSETFIKQGNYYNVHSYQFVSLTPAEIEQVTSATVEEVDTILRKFIH